MSKGVDGCKHCHGKTWCMVVCLRSRDLWMSEGTRLGEIYGSMASRFESDYSSQIFSPRMERTRVAVSLLHRCNHQFILGGDSLHKEDHRVPHLCEDYMLRLQVFRSLHKSTDQLGELLPPLHRQTVTLTLHIYLRHPPLLSSKLLH